MASNKKSKKKSNLNSQKVSTLLSTKEKIEKTKKEIIAVVESLLEESVTDQELINACKVLSIEDYKDVVEERNILNYCGYPLCCNRIKIVKQKYHISSQHNKVYDITDRKGFCTNECYKASNYLKGQLINMPVWLQELPTRVNLLHANDNRGTVGEEVELSGTQVLENDINPDNHVPTRMTQDDKKLFLEEIGQYAKDFKDLIVKEKSWEGQSSQVNMDTSMPNISDKMQHREPNSHYNSDSEEIESEDDSDDEKYFPKFEKGPLVEKYMPVPPKALKESAILIAPPATFVKKFHYVACQVSPDFILNVLQEWVTLETLKFLIGEDHVLLLLNSLQCSDDWRNNMNEIQSDKMKAEFHKLCMKLEKLEMEDDLLHKRLLDDSSMDVETGAGEIPDFFTFGNRNQSFQTTPSAKGKQSPKSCIKNKHVKKTTKKLKTGSTATKSVRFSPEDNKIFANADDDNNVSQNEPALPLIESVSQDMLRQKVVITKLRLVYLEFLPTVGFTTEVVSSILRQLVSSFRLTATNVIMKPAEWEIIAVTILRMLREKLTELDDSAFQKLLQKCCTEETKLTLEEIDNCIQVATDIRNIRVL